jgi:hypothetical protein
MNSRFRFTEEGAGGVAIGALTFFRATEVPEFRGRETDVTLFDVCFFADSGAQALQRIRSPTRNAFPVSMSVSETRLLHWTQ